MRVWRICKQKHQQSAFSGVGGLYTPGRWTPQGFPVVYTAESLALASLEVFVHTQSDRIPLIAIRAFLPDNAAMTEVDVSTLPTNWQKETAYPLLQEIGKQWLQARYTPILKVPRQLFQLSLTISLILSIPISNLHLTHQCSLSSMIECGK